MDTMPKAIELVCAGFALLVFGGMLIARPLIDWLSRYEPPQTGSGPMVNVPSGDDFPDVD